MKKSIFLFFLLLCLIAELPAQEGLRLYNLGVEEQEVGDYEEAIDLFTQAIGLNDIYVTANYYGRAQSFFELKKYEEAKQDIKNGLQTEKINSDKINVGLYWLRAAINGIEDNKIKELESYEKAIDYSPEDNYLKISYSLVLIELDREEEAIQILNLMIIDNKNAYAFNNRAFAFIRLKRYNEAKLDLEASKILDKENPFLYKNYFLYYQAIEDKVKACENLDLALNKNILDYGYQKNIDELFRLKENYCENN